MSTYFHCNLYITASWLAGNQLISKLVFVMLSIDTTKGADGVPTKAAYKTQRKSSSRLFTTVRKKIDIHLGTKHLSTDMGKIYQLE